MGLIASGLTDIGQKRSTNQDSIFYDNEKYLYIVADGMGGHKGGDIASAMAVEDIPEFIFNNSTSKTADNIKASIQHANNKIKAHGEGNPKLKGMGTTVVTLMFEKDTLYIGNVGDSRAYMVSKGKLYQLTIDHSLVQEKLSLAINANSSHYNREKAAIDPQKNVIVRTVGFEPSVNVDVYSYKVNKNDFFFICSDGLHGKVSDKDILEIINHHMPDPSTASQSDIDQIVNDLVKQANSNGGNDNISVIAVVAQ